MLPLLNVLRPNSLAHFWMQATMIACISLHLLYEAQIAGAEARDVGEDGGKLRGADAKPLGQGRGILNTGGRRNPAAIGTGIGRAAKRQLREGAIHLASLDRAANNEVMRTPRVVRTRVGVRLKGAAEIRHGEGSYIVLHAELLRRLVKSRECRTDGGKQSTLQCQLVGVGIEVADPREENL